MSYDQNDMRSFVALLGLREPITGAQVLEAIDERLAEMRERSGEWTVEYGLFDPPTDHLVRSRYIMPAMLRGWER